VVRGIRGAVSIEANTTDAILSATKELLMRLVTENQVETVDIAAVHFSATPDLSAAFPARAARQMGWENVPLFGHLEMDVPGAPSRCIRVLILVNTDLKQEQIKHIYLGETRRLREL